MASFISTPETVVEDMVQGVLLARPDLVHLEGHAVLLRRDYATNVRDAGKVAVLSGGGSGHEPAHAGFVGQGMLTGAICGGNFGGAAATPSAMQVEIISMGIFLSSASPGSVRPRDVQKWQCTKSTDYTWYFW